VGQSACLSAETLSAFVDGELSELDRRRAAEHLRSCAACSADISAFSRLDAELAGPPALTCAAALLVLSARHDGEAAPTDLAVADAHLATCDACRSRVQIWERVDAAIVAVPEALPSGRVDAAIRALGEERARRQRRVAVVNAMALRGAVATLLIVAVVALAALQPGPASAPVARQPIDGQQVVVAAMQQVVLNPRTNTLYVAHPESGTVGALDAKTQEDITTIVVGGRPSALALNEAENRILVLDATQKTLTEIDGSTNTVVGTTALDVSGTPTSIQVDSASGKIVLTSVGTPSPASPASSATTEVTVFNGTSKKLETTRAVPVAPSAVVLDSNHQRALLLSEDVTTVVDADTYKVLDKLPGGIAAVFSVNGKAIAVLSAAAGAANLLIAGDRSANVPLAGRPVALVALPLGGYAVLLDVGGKSRITELAADGVLGKSVEVDLVGRELNYNPANYIYVIAGATGIASVSIANPAAAAPQIVTPSPSPSASPAASASPGPSASPAGTSKPVTAAIEREPKVVEGATLAWPGVYRYELVARGAPMVVGHGTGGHLWFVDSGNRLSALDASSGTVYTIHELPSNARIRSIEVASKHVYAIDVAASRVYVVQLPSEKVSVLPLPFVKSSAAVTVTPDDKLWFAVADQILTLDPNTGKVEATYVGLYSVGALAADAAGRVWFSDEARKTIGLYDRTTHTVSELALPREGSVTSMVVDGSGTLWAGTDAGELFAIRGGALVSSRSLGRPVLELTLDPQGAAWFLTNDSVVATSGLARVPAGARVLPASVVGLWFDAKADAWLADRTSAGFFIAVPEPMP